MGEGQDPKEIKRQEAFALLADTIPYEKSAPIKILDMGAGYGALTKFLLERFPNATAICQDGSEEMAKLGRERMKHLAGRFEYVLCDFSKPGWSKLLPGPFEAIVSSIAIHNVGSPKHHSRHLRGRLHLGETGWLLFKFRPTPTSLGRSDAMAARRGLQRRAQLLA